MGLRRRGAHPGGISIRRIGEQRARRLRPRDGRRLSGRCGGVWHPERRPERIRVRRGDGVVVQRVQVGGRRRSGCHRVLGHRRRRQTVRVEGVELGRRRQQRVGGRRRRRAVAVVLHGGEQRLLVLEISVEALLLEHRVRRRTRSHLAFERRRVARAERRRLGGTERVELLPDRGRLLRDRPGGRRVVVAGIRRPRRLLGRFRRIAVTNTDITAHAAVPVAAVGARVRQQVVDAVRGRLAVRW